MVATVYKQAADKAKPMDSSDSDGSIPRGDPKWYEKCITSETYELGKYSNDLCHWLLANSVAFPEVPGSQRIG